jgi:hypothetical protein
MEMDTDDCCEIFSELCVDHTHMDVGTPPSCKCCDVKLKSKVRDMIKSDTALCVVHTEYLKFVEFDYFNGIATLTNSTSSCSHQLDISFPITLWSWNDEEIGNKDAFVKIANLTDLLKFEEMEIADDRLINLYGVTLLMTMDEDIDLERGLKFPVVVFNINHVSFAFYITEDNGTVRFWAEKFLDVRLGKHIQD